MTTKQVISGIKACQAWRDGPDSSLKRIEQLGWQPKNKWKNNEGHGVYAFIDKGFLTASQQLDPNGKAFRSRCELSFAAESEQSAKEIEKAVNRQFGSTKPADGKAGRTPDYPGKLYAKEQFYLIVGQPNAKGEVKLTTLIEWDPRFGLNEPKDN